jgi:hypothetical protein
MRRKARAQLVNVTRGALGRLDGEITRQLQALEAADREFVEASGQSAWRDAQEALLSSDDPTAQRLGALLTVAARSYDYLLMTYPVTKSGSRLLAAALAVGRIQAAIAERVEEYRGFGCRWDAPPAQMMRLSFLNVRVR